MTNPKQVDWRKHAKNHDADPDDEELAQTPQDVVETLGFDPKEFGEDKADPVEAMAHLAKK